MSGYWKDIVQRIHVEEERLELCRLVCEGVDNRVLEPGLLVKTMSENIHLRSVNERLTRHINDGIRQSMELMEACQSKRKGMSLSEEQIRGEK